MATELIKATSYYHRHGVTGWVALINGQPYHFPGNTGKKDAQEAIRKYTAAQQGANHENP